MEKKLMAAEIATATGFVITASKDLSWIFLLLMYKPDPGSSDQIMVHHLPHWQNPLWLTIITKTLLNPSYILRTRYSLPHGTLCQISSHERAILWTFWKCCHWCSVYHASARRLLILLRCYGNWEHWVHLKKKRWWMIKKANAFLEVDVIEVGWGVNTARIMAFNKGNSLSICCSCSSVLPQVLLRGFRSQSLWWKISLSMSRQVLRRSVEASLRTLTLIHSNHRTTL